MIDISKLSNVKVLGNGEYQAGCPVCFENGGDSKQNHLRIYKTGAYNCILDNSIDHNRRIKELCDDDSVETIQYIEKNLPPPKIYDESLINNLIKDYAYPNGRNIPNEVLEKFECGIASTGQMDKRFVFCVRDFDGKLIGFSGRDVTGLSPIPWKHIGSKSNFIFPPRSFSFDIAKQKEEIILVESVFCVLSLVSADIQNTLCLFGVNLGQGIFKYLIALNPKRIIIATNNDIKHKVGQEAAIKIKDKLLKFFNEDVVKIHLPTGKDFNCMSVEQIMIWYSKTKEINATPIQKIIESKED